MVASVVGDTITKIMERMSSLSVFGDKFITITNSIKHHLSNIKGVPEHSGAATPTPAWITDVMDVITDLWDLLDDQELLANAAVLPKQSNITSFFSLCDRIPRRRSLLLQLEGIEKRLQHVAVYSTELSRMNSTELTNSDVEGRETDKIVGREDEKEVIMSQVLALTKVKGVVNVVTILGMQGIGKTTLAKLVCRDERVKTNFDLVIWIDGVYDASYADSIVKRMIHESVTKKKKKKLEEKDEDLNLREAISGSTFLLVLDDFQSENDKEWFRLLQMLTAAACSSGATVLVTTQNYLVHESSHSRFYHVMGLSEDDSWTLFQQIARGGGGGPGESKIKNAQMKMVKKCRGVPLAIVTMARMLEFHQAITESNIEHLEEEFMQEMKMIYYNQLPSWHLKQYFAYLSLIFPTTDLHAPVETLIRLWMAEEFLGPINSNSNTSSPELRQPEDWGLLCLQEFQRRSILNVTEFQVGRFFCRMNEKLMLELSRFVAGEGRFCFCTDDRDKNVKGTVRGVALTRDFDVSNGVPEFLDKNNKYLRTIVFLKPYSASLSSRIPYEVQLSWSACEDIFCAFKSLRVLNLTDLGMNIIPSSIGELKNLKYLDLSHNSMKKLPSSIGKLKRLQTLILAHCHQLRELPHELKHLVSLRHLEIEGCLHLTHMPSALKKLTNLRSLSHFVTRNTSNNHHHKHIRGLAELIHLNNLRAKLEISHLERLKFKRSEQDGHAYLKEKQYLSFLHLQWNHDGEDNDGSNNHDQVSLAHLEPHPNLQKLCIKGYRGANFSPWLLSLKNLVRLILYNCSMCKSLPLFNQFPRLQILRLTRLDSLEYITDQDDGYNELGLELLRTLTISDCPKLSSWWKGRTQNNAILFGSISTLEVKYCPKLDCMPLFPNIDGQLELEHSSLKPLLETINYTAASCSGMQSNLDSTSNSSLPLSKVLFLIIKNMEEQSPLPEDWLKNFVSLHYLGISEKMSLMKGFKHLSSLINMAITNCTGVDLPDDEWEGLQSLQRLHIEEVIELKSLPEGIKHLTSLTHLIIGGCPELITLTEGIGHLTSLQWLWIADCHKLASFPKGMSNLKSLKKLTIRNCPLLLPRCQKETGDDWPQIKHIKDICLAGTSEIFE